MVEYTYNIDNGRRRIKILISYYLFLLIKSKIHSWIAKIKENAITKTATDHRAVLVVIQSILHHIVSEVDFIRLFGSFGTSQVILLTAVVLYGHHQTHSLPAGFHIQAILDKKLSVVWVIAVHPLHEQ